ncbi:alginate O-acetyltransferase AlgF [Deinococcus pimensis]|uniref:alginate O-acetyltransferase AlgF n=1 Tax=Deinococcus pimensis TaxID=309888 RepID=UPI0004B16BB8|nr:alginate O-acetyltransferase AlgF [Deinococcus pimensis]
MQRHKVLVILALASIAGAQSGLEQLYDPAPPPNSAFVRVVNGTADALDVPLGTVRASARARNASPYVVVPQGAVTLKVGRSTRAVTVEAGRFYSVAVTGNADAPRVTLLTDEANDDRAKALVAVYNLSKLATVDFKTADGKLTVVEGVTPNTTKTRAVNGVKVDLAVFSKATNLATFKDVQLERGVAYAVIVTDAGGKPTATWVRSATKTR